MGDKSPKSKRKLADQKQTRTDHLNAKRQAEITRAQLTKARIEATKKR